MNLQDFLAEYKRLKPNSRLHCLHYIHSGQFHQDCHWVIHDRLAALIRRLEASGPAFREEVLAELEGAAA